MATIICRGLEFGYDGADHDVFDGLDLVIDTRWRVALAGRNGRGKTTLLRLLAGQLEADAGSIEQAVPAAYFPPAVGAGDQSVHDVVKDSIGPFRRWEADMEGCLAKGSEAALAHYGEVLTAYQEAGGYAVDARLEAELVALGIGEDYWRRPFTSLSGGEQTRSLLAGLFAAQGRFPLIDEPTNHLDMAGRRRLAAYLRRKPGFVLVSHDRDFLDACCDHVVALNADSVEVRRTSFTNWRAEFRSRLAGQRQRNAELKHEIASLTEVARMRRAGALRREGDKTAHADKGFIGHRAAKQMKKAVIAERRARQAADARRATLVDVEKDRALKLPPGAKGAGALATANNLALWRGGKRVFADVSFVIRPGDRVAVTGPNGCGKTSLLDQLESAPHRQAGTLARRGHAAVARTHQHPLWASGPLRTRLEDAGLDEGRFRQIMAVLGVSGSVLDGMLDDLSDGQRKKVDLARSFMADADLLLWDEPLNYIDVDAREQIEEVLLRDKPTVVFVEHDAAFVQRVATKVIDLAACADP